MPLCDYEICEGKFEGEKEIESAGSTVFIRWLFHVAMARSNVDYLTMETRNAANLQLLQMFVCVTQIPFHR